MEWVTHFLSACVKSVISINYFYTILTGLFIILLLHYAYSPFKYWIIRGVPQVPVSSSIIGNLWESLTKSPDEISVKIYKEFSSDRYVGTYAFRTPALMVRDPELIEAVLIKDFSYASDRGLAEDPNRGKLQKHLLNLGRDHWKIMRNHLTPTFSSGKLKGMHNQLIECADSLITLMKQFEDGRPFEVRDVVSRLTMDVIASCAFGLNINTINDPNSEFRRMGLDLLKPSTLGKLAFVLNTLPKPMLQLLRFVSKSTSTSGHSDFFENAVVETLDHRKKNNLVRPDFLHLMNEIKIKEEERIRNKEMDANDPFIFDHSSLVSNAFVFFLAGFETTATTMSYAMYELAMNPDVQERLYKEVSTVLSKNEGIASYNAVQDMAYLDQVLSETLRKYPPVTTLVRKVSKEYKWRDSNLILPVGTLINIPVYALHHDEQYFPKPEKFIPERFDEGKNVIRKGTYLPFGEGPRMCIAARFAKLEAKVALAKIVSSYEIVQCDKTKSPLTFDRKAFLLIPEGGIWVAIQPRNKESPRTV